ncbi:MAG: hypothetical protein ACR5K2_00320 [Wolbachia sp.]
MIVKPRVQAWNKSSNNAQKQKSTKINKLCNQTQNEPTSAVKRNYKKAIKHSIENKLAKVRCKDGHFTLLRDVVKHLAKSEWILK